jgi:hypothetical protein
MAGRRGGSGKIVQDHFRQTLPAGLIGGAVQDAPIIKWHRFGVPMSVAAGNNVGRLPDALQPTAKKQEIDTADPQFFDVLDRTGMAKSRMAWRRRRGTRWRSAATCCKVR